MSEEKDLDKDSFDDTDNIEGFVDLEDLSNFDDFGDISELGDLSDLGDISDLGELSDIDLSDTDLSDIEIPDSDLADIDLSGIDLPDVDLADSDMSDAGLPDIDLDDNESTDIESSDGDIPTLDDIGKLAGINTVEPQDSDINGDNADIMSLADESVSGEEDAMSLDDESMSGGEDVMSLDEETMSGGEDVMALDDDTSSDGALDDMLDGLLDNLDMTGSIGDDVQADDTTFDLDELSEEQEETSADDLLDMLDNENEKPKKPGFFKKLFGNVVTEEIAEAERQAKIDEAAKEEEAEQLKKEKEEAKKVKAEEKAAKKAEAAADKAAKKAKKAEEKAAKKAEKQAKKEAEAEAAANEIVGKLNKAGVAVVVVFAVIILAGVIVGTNIFGYSSTKSVAEKDFKMGKYEDAYKEVLGTKISTKDPETYNKIITVMKVQHALDSYDNYEGMKYYPEALNSLLQGLKKYDDNIETARKLFIEADLESCKKKILAILSDEFGLSESEAYDILSLDTQAYTDKVVKIATEKY